MATFLIKGNGFFLTNLQEHQKDALSLSILIISAIFLILMSFVIILEILPTFFEKKDFSIEENDVKPNPSSYWKLILSKYSSLISLMASFVLFTILGIFLQLTIFTFFQETLMALKISFELLIGGILSIIFLTLIFTSIGVICSSKVLGTTLIVLMMGFLFLMVPISILLNIPVPSTQVVAADKTRLNANGTSTNISDPVYITTYSFKDNESRLYKYVAPFDLTSGIKSFFTIYNPINNNESINSTLVNTIFSVPKKANIEQTPWYNKQDYSVLYPSVLDGTLFLDSWDVTSTIPPDTTGGRPWNAAHSVDPTTKEQNHSNFAANGWYNKSRADEFGRESRIVSPLLGVDPNDVYIIDYQTYLIGQQWMSLYQTGPLAFKVRVLFYGALTQMLWSSDTFLQNSNITNLDQTIYDGVTTNDAGLYYYPTPVYSSSQTIRINNDPNNLENVYLTDSWSDNSDLKQTGGQYRTIGDLYLAYLNDDYNPQGTAKQDRIGSYSIGSTTSAPYPEQQKGMYLNFFQFIGSISSWGNLNKTVETINGETFIFDWAQTFEGIDQLIANSISQTFFNENRSKLGDWNYYKSIALYELIYQSKKTIYFQTPGEAAIISGAISLTPANVLLGNFLEFHQVQNSLTINFDYFIYAVEGALLGYNSDGGLLGQILDDWGYSLFDGSHSRSDIDFPAFWSDTIDSYNFYQSHIEANTTTTNIYTIPTQPQITGFETLKRIKAVANGYKGIDNQTYYEVHYQSYIKTYQYVLIFTAITIIFVSISGVVIIKRGYL